MSNHAKGASHYGKIADEASADRPFIGGDMVQDQYGTRYVVYDVNTLIISSKGANRDLTMKLVARPELPE